MKTNVLVLVLVLVLLLPRSVHADRITQMTQSDLCIYTAKLQVAGYYYFEQGKSREEVKIVRGSRLRSMHERQALTGVVLALILLVATPTRAEKDAASKAREGDINHWIEYYRSSSSLFPLSPALLPGVSRCTRS
jgi:hypothetical protein